jgi:deoxycytidine triphosphate deaminase
MTIKSDKWIRRMAEEYGMIEPFEPGQIREVDGRRVISYGTSSYGYDIRCAPEFKVFTNIHSTVVDPKKVKGARLELIFAMIPHAPPPPRPSWQPSSRSARCR